MAVDARRAPSAAIQPRALRTNRRYANGTMFALIGLLVVAGVYAHRQLPAAPGFFSLGATFVATTDGITAYLLLSEAALVGSEALAVLACAYIYTSVMVAGQMLIFPGNLFLANLGWNSQAAAWTYLLWHAGYPLLVLAYIHVRRRVGAADGGALRLLPLIAIIATAAFFGVIIAGSMTVLPPLLIANKATIASTIFTGISLAINVCVLVISLRFLWGEESPIDVWLAVAVFAATVDAALLFLTSGRYTVSWYASRIGSIVSGSSVLAGLFYEIIRSRQEQLAFALGRNEELADLNRELEAFSYSVSHDLRAPARSIMGFAHAIEEDYSSVLDDEGRRLLSVVVKEGSRMGDLIDDLLALAKLGRQSMTREPVDVATLVREVLAEVQSTASAAQPLIELADLPGIHGDRALLRQVWVNLLSNAIKYSSKKPEPQVWIWGDLEPSRVVYHVRDNGAGFDMLYADKLFGVFQRLHRNAEFPGTGVGLAIVQRIVHRHGGTVWAEAHLGAGATFSFALPIGEG